jgi:hypothetical protein
MKANELRIGNWIYIDTTGQPVQDRLINGAQKWDDWYAYYEFGYDESIFKPIPLTEEWLTRFGFEKFESMHGNEYRLERDGIDGFILEYQDDYSILIAGNEHDMGITPSVKMFKHVHQLQNLYFALTGEELELKAD